MRQIWVGCILLSTALSSQAATLGRYSGAAVIGRPLDVRMQVLLGPGDDIVALCAQADVFYGDSQVSPASVRVVPQKSAPDAEASVRVQSSVAVDEPVVTVYVRAGCTTPFSRRYVLLADPLSEPQSAAQTAGSNAQPMQSAAAPARGLPTVNPNSGGAGTPRSGDAGQSSPDSGAAAAPRKPAAPAPVASASAALPKARASKKATRPASVVRRELELAVPRLELDPVDVSLSIDRDPVLKLSLAMLSEPTASEEERAAAGLLWKVINASPEDILRDTQKLAVLEAESKGLREQEARSKAALQELEGRLEQTRHLRWLVYGMGALLALAAIGLLYFWRRRNSGDVDNTAARAWWAAATAEKEMEKGQAVPNGKAGAEALDLDLDLDLGSGPESALDSMSALHDSGLAALSTPALLNHDRRDFRSSQFGSSRSVATEELFDVQQQADFFISLGEHDQAIQVLKNHMAESQEPSALAYLDLFRLYHKLDRKGDYEKLREEFNHLFNAGAPPFEQYSDASRGLEGYETAFGRIQALWPQPRVLDVIEQSIFREPGDTETEVFDLEAYRELLLLHAMAKDMIKRDAAGSNPTMDFQHTAIRPLKAAGNKMLTAAMAGESRATQPMEYAPQDSPLLGLDVDVDLDELSEISAFEASLPEVSVPVEPSAKPLPPRGLSPDAETDNLIDFEMLDFMPPEEDGAAVAGKAGKKN